MRGIGNTRREMLAAEKACKICGNTELLDVAPIVMPELLGNQLAKDALIVVCPRCTIDIRPTALGMPNGKFSVDELFALNGTTYDDVKAKLGERPPQHDQIAVVREIRKKNPPPPRQDPPPPPAQPPAPANVPPAQDPPPKKPKLGT